MTHETVGLSGVPNMGDGQVSATILDAVLDAERTEKILRLAHRIDRLRCKAEKHLATARAELDEVLQGHPLEDRLRTRFSSLWNMSAQSWPAFLSACSAACRCSPPAQSQKQFEDCMALQLRTSRPSERPAMQRHHARALHPNCRSAIG